MKCSICGFSDESLMKEKAEALLLIDKELASIEASEKEVADKFKIENNFTDEVKEAVKQISAELQDMTVSAFLDNVDAFLKLEARLYPILTYYDKFHPKQINRSFSSKQANLDKSLKIKDIIESFLLEPLPQRYKREFHSELDIRRQLLQAKKELEEKETFFTEQVFTQSSYGFSNLLTMMLKRVSINSGKHLFKDYQVLLCPVCSNLFKEASKASFDFLEAKRIENEDIWD